MDLTNPPLENQITSGVFLMAIKVIIMTDWATISFYPEEVKNIIQVSCFSKLLKYLIILAKITQQKVMTKARGA